MRKKLSVCVSSVALAVSLSAVALPSSANAVTLMDILRGRDKEADRPPVVQSQQPNLQQKTYTPVHVSPPKYYTYKPDALRLISIGEIRDPVVTSSITPDALDKDQDVASLNDGTSVDATMSDAPDMTTDSEASVKADAGADANTPKTPTTVSIGPNDPRQYLSDARVKAIDAVATAVEKYYTNGGELIWVADGQITPKAKQALQVLKDADQFGLDPADYHIDMPDLDAAVDDQAREEALMQFELALSAQTLSYMHDAKRGRVDPNRISEFHDLKLNPVDLDTAVEDVHSTDDVVALMDSYNPDSERFKEFTAELKTLRDSDDYVEPIVFETGTFMRPGDNEDQLPKLIKAIKRKSDPDFIAAHQDVFDNYDGGTLYSPEVVSLVRDFQKSQGLYVDGVVGSSTLSKLEVETDQARINKIVAAMERLRWLPDHFGPRYVFINQPAFRVYYHDDNGQNFDMRVVVGNPTNQTYFFSDEIQTVEFNPYWGVPRSIIVNEYLPKLRANPSYFDQRGYEVSYNGRQVSSASVNWAAAPMVDVRRKPGPSNALGQLKILFPNAHAIYMHDTPQKSFFSRDQRDLSHGCVRLADPKKMAAAVLGIPESDVDANIATGQNMPVDVPNKFPVYVAYFTAWPDANGDIQYYDDVYKRDMYLERAFTAETKVRAQS